MKVYYNEHGDLIEDPAAALAGNVYVYSTRRGDFIFPVEQRLPVIAAEAKRKEESSSASTAG